MGIDPVAPEPGNIHSFNRYAYGNNNPLKYTDPDGQQNIRVIVALRLQQQPLLLRPPPSSPQAPPLAPIIYRHIVQPVTMIVRPMLRSSRVESSQIISVSKERYPESAKHIEDAIKSGKPNTLTIERSGAKERRKEALKDIKTQKGLDRDEYPPAMFKEGGKGAPVKPINPSDNRGAASCIGAQCRNLPNGTKVKIEITKREGMAKDAWCTGSSNEANPKKILCIWWRLFY